MRPHYSDSYEGCINRCDPTLCEILQVNIDRPSPTSSSTQSSQQNIGTNRNVGTNRNIGTNQNRGEAILMLNTSLHFYATFMCC